MGDSILMKCGCRASAVLRSRGHQVFDPPIPCCPIHDCQEPAETVPDLSARQARCSCNNKRPSSLDLAFFEYRGEGSPVSQRTCKHCGYYEVAHGKSHVRCKTFEPHGAYEFDSYYCGHAGWD